MIQAVQPGGLIWASANCHGNEPPAPLIICISNGTLFPIECTTFWPEPYEPYWLWSKVVHSIGNRVPFRTILSEGGGGKGWRDGRMEGWRHSSPHTLRGVKECAGPSEHSLQEPSSRKRDGTGCAVKNSTQRHHREGEEWRFPFLTLLLNVYDMTQRGNATSEG